MTPERPVGAPAVDAATSDPTDIELVEAVRADDGAALGVLYDRHAGLVFGTALAILQKRDEAEDLTQEVFVALSVDRAFDPARGQLRSFLVALTRSRAIDRVRARGRHLRLLKRWHNIGPAPPSPQTPLQHCSTKECAERVRAALGDLSDREREVLELAYFRGLTQAEIAERLDTPLGTVKSWARRGLSSLKANLQDLVG